MLSHAERLPPAAACGPEHCHDLMTPSITHCKHRLIVCPSKAQMLLLLAGATAAKKLPELGWHVQSNSQ